MAFPPAFSNFSIADLLNIWAVTSTGLLISPFPKIFTAILACFTTPFSKSISGFTLSSPRVDILSKLYEENYLCYALSNWSSETFEGMIVDYPFLKKFDGIILSGQEKIIKPLEGIFLIAIDRYKLIPSETIFIDDNIDNINSAHTIGFKTIHLKDPSIIRKKI